MEKTNMLMCLKCFKVFEQDNKCDCEETMYKSIWVKGDDEE